MTINFKKQQKKNVKSAQQTVDEVIDTISKNGIPTHLYVSFYIIFYF